MANKEKSIEKKSEEKSEEKLDQVSGGMIFPNGRRVDYSLDDAKEAARANRSLNDGK